MYTQIGWFNLREDKVFRNYFETAAWYEDVKVKAGRYPIEVSDMRIDKDGEVRGFIDSCYIRMKGKIESDNFQSLFCGVPIGEPYDTQKNKGSDSTHTSDMYLYQLAECVLNGNREYELFPEFEAKEQKFYSDISNQWITTHGIYRESV